jgi:UMF1 family MFS transporter
MPDDSGRRSAQRAWCFYDWANSAFATSVVSAILPVYFARMAAKTMPAHEATALWGYASAAALAITAVLSPVMGALADQSRRRKPLLLGCVLIGAAGTFALAFVPPTSWMASCWRSGSRSWRSPRATCSTTRCCRPWPRPPRCTRLGTRIRVGLSGRRVVAGRAPGAHRHAAALRARRSGEATRIAFASVAAWWLGFSIPLFRRVPEPEAERAGVPARQLPGAVWRQLRGTIAGLRAQPDLLKFLIAFWLYSDGIGTIIKMATVYGVEVGLQDKDLMGALLMVQLLAAPASIVFGRLATPLGPRGAVMLGIAGYTGISVFAFFLAHAWQFWTLAALVALFQGGTQALSRSMFASLVPRERTSEMFGFYSVSEKLAGVAGPVLFGLITQATGGGRMATLSLLPLFLGGAWLLSRVDLARGQRAAQGAPAG